jgi:hypothetical protein
VRKAKQEPDFDWLYESPEGRFSVGCKTYESIHPGAIEEGDFVRIITWEGEVLSFEVIDVRQDTVIDAYDEVAMQDIKSAPLVTADKESTSLLRRLHRIRRGDPPDPTALRSHTFLTSPRTPVIVRSEGPPRRFSGFADAASSGPAVIRVKDVHVRTEGVLNVSTPTPWGG